MDTKVYNSIKKYKQLVMDDIKKYTSYAIINDVQIYPNPDYNLLTRRNIEGENVLFCPELLDEDCFAYYSKYVHDKKNIRETYRKVLDFTVSFSFISMLVYSLACTNRNSDNSFIILGNWIPKSIITDDASDNNQITLDNDGNNVYWFKYSTVKFVNDFSSNEPEKNYLNGTIMSDYLIVTDINKTKIMPYDYYDYEGNYCYGIKKITKNSFYKPTEKLWELVDKARNGKLTFVTIERKKIKALFFDKIRPLSRKNSTKIDENERQSFLKINIKDFDKEIVQKYRGYRKKGEIVPYISLNNGTMNPSKLIEGSIPVSCVEMYIRSLFDTETGITFENVSMSVDMFQMMSKKQCTFRKDPNYDMTTYFEFDPDLLISVLKDSAMSKKYDNHLLYQIYEILSKCEEYNDKYYFCVNYIRKENGRFYGVKNYIQNMPKALRKIVLSKYQSVDMNCGVYSLLLNIAKKLKYRGNTTEIEKMVYDRKAYRENLIDDELGITYSDVKDKLTMISFGCRMNPEKMLSSSEYEMLNGDDDGYYKPYHTSLYKDEDTERKINISKWCNKDEVIKLHNEIEHLGKFIIRKSIQTDDEGNKRLINSMGNIIEINNRTRHTFGEKLAFIYQSEESVVLKSIVDNFKVGRRKLNNIKGGIGLLLHDAVYVHKSLLKNYADISKNMSEYVKDNFGYDIRYESE